ncbi:NAD-dependent epimerase/dehydratase [Caballeronia sordidicola]|uniref:NAD-dependent epimerase/dehydratase n=1 Tax=Caballeronia sordidicola TaxID=196367 RepID=A0A158IDN4_CABSO|nr:NAD-dependent epimerase/dehydratase family protein [Caballeronia sordidicola]SAL54379.1 NAD-dependent epimerase/dehydratase [Caballeronia sordidicola]
MKVIIFGATGMVGQGVLRECLLDPDIERVLAVGRSSTRQLDPRFTEIVHSDLFDLSAIEDKLTGFDACFFCLGVSSFRMNEADYAHLTYDLTFGIARTLSRLNPAMTFSYVSGSGTDSTERGNSMWARVKGRTENALLRMPFRAAYMFRPGMIQPMDGIRSKTPMYQAIISIARPLFPLLRRSFPNAITTTQQLGRAMIVTAKERGPSRALEPRDITKY